MRVFRRKTATSSSPIWRQCGGFFPVASRKSLASGTVTALIDRDGQATLYCNELQQIASIRFKGQVEKGQWILKDDVATIDGLSFCDAAGNALDIPRDNGIALMFSVGFRKCLYYNFEPILPNGASRSLDMARVFGRFYQYLSFPELNHITDDQWDAMINWGWFPFVWMTTDDRKKLIGFSTRSQEPKQIFEEICEKFKALAPQKVASWKSLPIIGNDHGEFVDKADRAVSCRRLHSAISNLLPRLEDIMDTFLRSQKTGQKIKQGTMANALVANHDDYSLLLPARFRDYLQRFYFRDFDKDKGNRQLSRNSHGHGASLSSDYDFKRASVGFMILDQM